MRRIEDLIVELIEAHERRKKRPMRTKEIAIKVNYSQRSIQRICSQLEAQGILHRPFGDKSGYATKCAKNAE